MNLARLLAGGAKIAGSTLEGFGIDKNRRIADALNQQKQAADERRDAVLNAIAGRSYDPNRGAVVNVATGTASPVAGLPAPIQEPVEYTPAKFMSGGKAVQGFTTKGGGYFDASRNPVADATPYEEPKTAPKPNLVPVDTPTPDGGVKRVLAEERPGLEVPGPNNIMAGSAALKKQIAANKSQLLVIDDALAELEKNPDAVGLKRGVGEIIPFMGGVQDQINQRFDPEGVGARAQIANIGSLKLHDRSGAAVTISEFPRLKPFIPTSADTPDAIRRKMAKLREGIEAETAELERSISTRPAGATPPTAGVASADPEFDALMAKYKKKP